MASTTYMRNRAYGTGAGSTSYSRLSAALQRARQTSGGLKKAQEAFERGYVRSDVRQSDVESGAANARRVLESLDEAIWRFTDEGSTAAAQQLATAVERGQAVLDQGQPAGLTDEEWLALTDAVDAGADLASRSYDVGGGLGTVGWAVVGVVTLGAVGLAVKWWLDGRKGN